MSDPKIHPVFIVRGERGAPTHGMYALYATSDENFEQARKNGGAVGLRRYELDNIKPAHYKNRFTDNATERRNRAVSLDYRLPTQDEYNSVQAWESVYTEQERAQVDKQIEKYELLIDELEAEQAADPNKTLPAAKDEQLADYRLTLGVLRNEQGAAVFGGGGFLTEVPSVFGYGGKCIHDGNSAPNVHKIRRSTFLVGSDRAFHLARRWAEPNEKQRTTSEKLRFGPFVLEVRGGASVLISMYAQKYYTTGSDEEIEAIVPLETELDSCLDQGRLTDEDMNYIDEQQTAIRRVEAEVRKQKIKRDTPAYQPFFEQTETARENIIARRKLKRKMPGAIRERANEIIATLYQIHEQNVNLQEASENFYGDEGILRLTIVPQKRGFLTLIVNGKEEVNIEIPEIIESRKYGTLWQPTQLILESKGGAGQWQFMFPAVDSKSQFRLDEVELPFELQPDDLILLDGDWDKSGPGTDIAFAVHESPNHTAARPLYDFVATLRSDKGRKEDPANTGDITNAYFPWLYSLQFTIQSGELPERETPIWNSSDFGTVTHWYGLPFNPNVDNPILAVSLSQDPIENGWRGMRIELDIADPDGTANFKGFEENWCDFHCGLWLAPTSYDGGVLTWPINTENGVAGVVPYLQDGVITSAILMNVKELKPGDPGQEYSNRKIDSFWRVSVADIFAVLDDYTLEYDIILDNQTLGGALRRIIGATGIPQSRVAGIPTTGNLAGPILPKPGAGEPPKKVAQQGRKAGQMCIELLSEYGMSLDYKELGLIYRNRSFSLIVADETPVASFTGAPDENAAFNTILEGAQIVHDWENFHNIFNVEGARDRKTGKPLKASYSIPESWLDGYESHPLRIGFPKAAPLIKRPELDTQALVEEAVTIAAIRGAKNGKSEVVPTFWLYPPRFVGDTIEIDGAAREIIRLQDMNIRGQSSASLATRERIALP